jgi:hypothetical protein
MSEMRSESPSRGREMRRRGTAFVPCLASGERWRKRQTAKEESYQEVDDKERKEEQTSIRGQEPRGR